MEILPYKDSLDLDLERCSSLLTQDLLGAMNEEESRVKAMRRDDAIELKRKSPNELMSFLDEMQLNGSMSNLQHRTAEWSSGYCSGSDGHGSRSRSESPLGWPAMSSTSKYEHLPLIEASPWSVVNPELSAKQRRWDSGHPSTGFNAGKYSHDDYFTMDVEDLMKCADYAFCTDSFTQFCRAHYTEKWGYMLPDFDYSIGGKEKRAHPPRGQDIPFCSQFSDFFAKAEPFTDGLGEQLADRPLSAQSFFSELDTGLESVPIEAVKPGRGAMVSSPRLSPITMSDISSTSLSLRSANTSPASSPAVESSKQAGRSSLGFTSNLRADAPRFTPSVTPMYSGYISEYTYDTDCKETDHEDDIVNENGVSKISSLDETQSVDNPRFKTEICRNFNEKGQCPYGSQCQFAHGNTDMRDTSKNNKYKTKLCQKYWIAGVCPYGARCNFLHNEKACEGVDPLGPPSNASYYNEERDHRPVNNWHFQRMHGARNWAQRRHRERSDGYYAY